MKKLIYLLVLCLCLNGTALVLAESGGAKVTSTTSEKAGKEAAAKKGLSLGIDFISAIITI